LLFTTFQPTPCATSPGGSPDGLAQLLANPPTMKTKDARKEKKKAPTKTLKEKKAAKAEKKKGK
jgi:hypothetical protein